MDALCLPQWQAFLRYSDLPGRPPVLVYLTGVGLAVSGTFDRCIVDPALARQRAVLVDVLGAGLSDAPEASRTRSRTTRPRWRGCSIISG